ncbi:MAG: sigma 54-interacting transcriptional regulator, partial [Proteobacteria bacterium]|nr:sigma 54-interacting transcriptional regulator [Pseudomonadota bacterium]
KKNGKVTAVFGQVMFKNLKEIQALAKTLEMMESRVRMYEQELTALRRARYTMESIKGVSDTISRLRGEASQAATHSLPVFITGESGTGKEVFAQAIHNASARRHHSFVRINCAAIPHDLFESELFGYAKGAFTGALSQGKPGKFELAGQGTIFLDEIGEMPLEMQPKLLQVLEERVFERVGGVKPIQARCRIIAATNQNVELMMAEGGFRKDLFFRLNVVPIHISPLRERREDILPISCHLLEQISQDFGQVRYSLSEEAAAILKACDWLGNVRELFNVLERTLSLMEGNEIKGENLPLYLRKQPNLPATDNNWNLKGIIGLAEKKVLSEALAFTNNNKAQTAKLLGIDRTVLYRKMKKYKIPV